MADLWLAAADPRRTPALRKTLQAARSPAPNAREDHGRAPLHLAASTGNAAAVAVLLDQPTVDVNLADTESLWTALHRAIYYGNYRVALLLLRAGASLARPDANGDLPLDLYTHARHDVEQARGDARAPRQGLIYSYHSGADDQLGYADNRNVMTPKRVDTVATLPCRALVASKYASCAIVGGTVFTWGQGYGGRLGHGDERACAIPRPVAELSQHRVAKIACGPHHTVALLDCGQVYAWGSNEYGQLGISSARCVLSPTHVATVRSAQVEIAAGDCFTLALPHHRQNMIGWGTGLLSVSQDDTLPVPKRIDCGINDRRVAKIFASGKAFGFLLATGECHVVHKTCPTRLQLPKRWPASIAVYWPHKTVVRDAVLTPAGLIFVVTNNGTLYHSRIGAEGALQKVPGSARFFFATIAASDLRFFAITRAGAAYLWNAERLAKGPSLVPNIAQAVAVAANRHSMLVTSIRPFRLDPAAAPAPATAQTPADAEAPASPSSPSRVTVDTLVRQGGLHSADSGRRRTSFGSGNRARALLGTSPPLAERLSWPSSGRLLDSDVAQNDDDDVDDEDEDWELPRFYDLLRAPGQWAPDVLLQLSQHVTVGAHSCFVRAELVETVPVDAVEEETVRIVLELLYNGRVSATPRCLDNVGRAVPVLFANPAGATASAVLAEIRRVRPVFAGDQLLSIALPRDLVPVVRAHTSGVHADVTFVVEADGDGPVRFRAHRAVLCARSEYFGAMFSSQMLEAASSDVALYDVSPWVFEHVLRYLYTGRLELAALDLRAESLAQLAPGDATIQTSCAEIFDRRARQVWEILVYAHSVLLTDLVGLCERALAECVLVSNAPDMLEMAIDHHAPALRDALLSFIALNVDVYVTGYLSHLSGLSDNALALVEGKARTLGLARRAMAPESLLAPSAEQCVSGSAATPDDTARRIRAIRKKLAQIRALEEKDRFRLDSEQLAKIESKPRLMRELTMLESPGDVLSSSFGTSPSPSSTPFGGMSVSPSPFSLSASPSQYPMMRSPSPSPSSHHSVISPTQLEAETRRPQVDEDEDEEEQERPRDDDDDDLMFQMDEVVEVVVEQLPPPTAKTSKKKKGKKPRRQSVPGDTPKRPQQTPPPQQQQPSPAAKPWGSAPHAKPISIAASLAASKAPPAKTTRQPQWGTRASPGGAAPSLASIQREQVRARAASSPDATVTPPRPGSGASAPLAHFIKPGKKPATLATATASPWGTPQQSSSQAKPANIREMLEGGRSPHQGQRQQWTRRSSAAAAASPTWMRQEQASPPRSMVEIQLEEQIVQEQFAIERQIEIERQMEIERQFEIERQIQMATAAAKTETCATAAKGGRSRGKKARVKPCV